MHFQYQESVPPSVSFPYSVSLSIMCCTGSITSALSFPRIGSQKCNKQLWGEVIHVSPFQFIKQTVTIFGEGLYLEQAVGVACYGPMQSEISSEIKTSLVSSFSSS